MALPALITWSGTITPKDFNARIEGKATVRQLAEFVTLPVFEKRNAVVDRWCP
ncbi:MAG TPA: hypothetical protein VJM12_13510 [Pyrinomonadaceae bacterium]|nr:hypothetical protein [Pyrinomonadaceae bacterium]